MKSTGGDERVGNDKLSDRERLVLLGISHRYRRVAGLRPHRLAGLVHHFQLGRSSCAAQLGAAHLRERREQPLGAMPIVSVGRDKLFEALGRTYSECALGGCAGGQPSCKPMPTLLAAPTLHPARSSTAGAPLHCDIAPLWPFKGLYCRVT